MRIAISCAGWASRELLVSGGTAVDAAESSKEGGIMTQVSGEIKASFATQ